MFGWGQIARSMIRRRRTCAVHEKPVASRIAITMARRRAAESGSSNPMTAVRNMKEGGWLGN